MNNVFINIKLNYLKISYELMENLIATYLSTNNDPKKDFHHDTTALIEGRSMHELEAPDAKLKLPTPYWVSMTDDI